MNFALTLVLMLLLIATANLAAAKTTTTSVLFIGNSLTSKNNLAKMFTLLAKARRKRVKVYTKTVGSALLLDHAQSYFGTMDLIRARNYSVIVLQDQSSFLARGDEFSRKQVWPAALRLAEAARLSGARVVLYETMAYIRDFVGGNTHEEMQAEIVRGYESLRAYLKAETCHAGKAFALAKQNMEDFNSLYADDRHPSNKGTFLVASSFYATLFKQSPVGIRPSLWLRKRKVTLAFAKQAEAWAASANPFR